MPGNVPGVPGFSPDPAKRARQLAGLAKTNSVVAERLAAGHYDLPPAPETAPPAPAPAPAPAASPSDGPAQIAGVPIQQRSPDARPEPDEPHAPAPDPEPVAGADPASVEPEPERRRGILGRFAEGFAEG